MRHPINIPQRSKNNLADRVNELALTIDPLRFGDEPDMTAALVKALDGFSYSDEYISVRFEGAVMKRSTESWAGADFAVVTTITIGNEEVKKATLVQSKLGRVDVLEKSNRREFERLADQVLDMEALISCPKVLILVDTSFEHTATPTIKMIAYRFPQDTPANANFKNRNSFGVSVNQIEGETKLDFFPDWVQVFSNWEQREDVKEMQHW